MRGLFFLIILLCCFFSGFTQPIKEKLRFYKIDTEDGLPSMAINSIIQDSTGFIWVGTDDGLSRYDGRHFTTFQKNGQDSSGLSNNFVQQMFLGKDNNIWVPTDGGLDLFNSRLEQFSHFTTRDGLLGNSVNSVIEGPSGMLIIGVYRQGVHLRHADGSYSYLTHDPDNPLSISSEEISSMILQGDSLLYVGTYNQGVNKIWLEDKRIERIPFGLTHALPSGEINQLYQDSDENLWIGSKAGVQVITRSGDTLQLTSSDQEGQGLSDQDVLSFEEDRLGNMWIGTRNGGLNIVNRNAILEKDSQAYVQWFQAAEDGESIYNRTVTDLLCDREGNMWIGTSTGVNFTDPTGETIRRLTRNPASDHSLSHDRISALEQAKNGRVWVGTDGGGLDLYDPVNGVFKHYRHQDHETASISNNYVLSLKRDSKGRLWAGTYQGGINFLAPNADTFKHYLQGSVSEGSDVRCILEDQKETIWVGTNRGGLFHYDEQEDRFRFVDSLKFLDIRDMAESSDGSLWLATFGSGIYHYFPETNDYQVFDTHGYPQLPTDIILSIRQTSDNMIWAGTRYGGLIRLDPLSGKMTVYQEQDGLSNNTVSSIIVEGENILWLGTHQGISRFDISNSEFSHIQSQENIQQGAFTEGAALKSDQGLIYLGGDQGLYLFHPEKVFEKEPAAPVVLTGLKVFNEPVSVDEHNSESILSKALHYTDQLNISYKNTQFSIDFAALSFPFSHNVTYAYQLENFDDRWVETGESSTANFSNVPPGEYIFKVRATNTSQGGNQACTSMAITITPPFWKTWPAYLLYAMLSFLVVWGVSRYYLERLRLKDSLILEKRQRQLEFTLNEERLHFFTSFSHELKTPLTLILGPVEDLIQKLDTSHQGSLKLIQKNASYLLHLINKLLEIRKSETGLSQLNTKLNDLGMLLDDWIGQYQIMAKRKGIKLIWKNDNAETRFYFDEEKIHMIVNNLLSNAFKFTPRGGTITVHLSRQAGNILFSVADNGSGMNEATKASIFTWYFSGGSTQKVQGTGIGLALSRKMAELHHGTITVESKLNQGARFDVLLPMGHPSENSLNHINEIPENERFSEISTIPEERLMPSLAEKEEPSIIHTGMDKERAVVLIIDDNQDVIQYLKSILGSQFHIISAADGQQGLEKAIQYIPDLIISDIMMPARSGIELCKVLKQKSATSHIPIILLSAKGNIDSFKAGYQEGADAYMTKPFNSQLLLIRVNNLLQQRVRLRQYFGSSGPSDLTMQEANSPLFQKEKQFLEQLEKVIDIQLEEGNTNVEEIARQLGMSRTSLYRKIKSISGKNINEYIRMIRLNRAYDLITREGLSVSQAAFQVGFSSVKYFRKLIKEQFGKLPSELSQIDEDS